MFSINSIGAYFMLMSGYFYTKLCSFLSSNMLVSSVLAFCFGVWLLITVIQYFSRKTGAEIIPHGYVSLGSIVKVVVFYLLGLAMLVPDTSVEVKSFQRKSFSDSRYIVERMNGVDPEIKLSLPTALMVKSSEEVGWFAMKMVDFVMGGTHSFAETPNLYYKAMLLGSASQIEDKKLREKMELYTVDCLQPLLPRIKSERDKSFGLDNIGKRKFEFALSYQDEFTEELESIKTTGGMSCNSLRKIIHSELYADVQKNSGWMDKFFTKIRGTSEPVINYSTNYKIASALTNYYREKYEGSYGVMKGAKVPGLYGRFYQHLGKFFGIEGQLRDSKNLKKYAGAGAAIERAKEFNEQLRTAPMIQGLCKGGLIVFSAFFTFFMVFMKWRVIIWTWMVYLSVCLWPAIWAGLYKLIGALFSISQNLEQFGSQHDSFSLLAATQVSDQVYYASQVIYWAAVVACPGVTGLVGFFGGQWLMSSREDHVPTSVQQATQTTALATQLGRGL